MTRSKKRIARNILDQWPEPSYRYRFFYFREGRVSFWDHSKHSNPDRRDFLKSPWPGSRIFLFGIIFHGMGYPVQNPSWFSRYDCERSCDMHVAWKLDTCIGYVWDENGCSLFMNAETEEPVATFGFQKCKHFQTCKWEWFGSHTGLQVPSAVTLCGTGNMMVNGVYSRDRDSTLVFKQDNGAR